jgi:hypothetical protein
VPFLPLNDLGRTPAPAPPAAAAQVNPAAPYNTTPPPSLRVPTR